MLIINRFTNYFGSIAYYLSNSKYSDNYLIYKHHTYFYNILTTLPFSPWIFCTFAIISSIVSLNLFP